MYKATTGMNEWTSAEPPPSGVTRSIGPAKRVTIASALGDKMEREFMTNPDPPPNPDPPYPPHPPVPPEPL